MLQDIQGAIVLGILLAFLIGPVFFVLLETAALKGFRAAIAVDLGVIFADIIFILLAYFGTSKILEKIKDDPALFIFGGMLLATYGVISFLKERKNYNRVRDTSVEIINKNNYIRLFIKGFLLNFINIGVLAFWIGIVVVAGPQMDMNTNRIIFFFCLVLGTYFVVDIIKILLAKRLKEKLTPKRIYFVKKIVSVVMIIFGGFLIAKGLIPDTMEKKLQDRFEQIRPE
ncbi:LysE family translocator [Aquimarina sp. ERC-38]|uniref:LysE family translocator n=1 Tax=Aquimarina sp. ERC-38 TaxID=2949996 RepID=UPI00224821CE|nr:LysE family transporter [Aquimarina sp. ERC-38]UZO81831.1 LysE family translocator [Aquimarina sp. ERC-38]